MNKTANGGKGDRGVSEIFFNASAAASLASYKKNGRIPVAVSVLIKNGKNYDLMPLGENLPDMDVRLLEPVLDHAVLPLVEYIAKNEGSYPVVFFMSVSATAGLKDDESGDIEDDAEIIINAARTQANLGKTNVYKITKKGFVKLVSGDDDEWVKKDDEEDDIAASLAQTVLDMLWKSYIVTRNMAMLTSS